MTPVVINKALVGRKVSVPNRPEWGVGTVLRVLSTTENGAPVHRVHVQFHLGARVLIIPPATLVEPIAEATVERQVGWLDGLAGRTVDDRLTKLPESIELFLGTQAQKIAAMAPLYEIDADDPKALGKWAKRQTNVADPLSHWSRDELHVAFGRFCTERDSTLRMAFAKLKEKEGPGAIEETLAGLDPRVASAMRVALRRPV